MRDALGREISYMRLSVTDRCNLRCRYCMPEEGVEWVEHDRILSYEQIVRLVRAAAGLGIDTVRLTGGEPLVRKGLDKLVWAVKAIDGIRTVTLTTNGVLLAQQLPALRAAGLDGVNLSLDTLDREQYAAITRRDLLPRALEGLEAALNTPGLKVKLNCVPMGDNDDQLVPLAALARDGKLPVDKMNGGTFTVTNIGAFGCEAFTPVINPPQTGILGVCNIQTKIKSVNGGSIETYPAMGLSLTFDHRVVDGAPAARFMQALCQNLENFLTLLAK